MYSGTTLLKMRPFDAWFGAHQKIDRIARAYLKRLVVDDHNFPSRQRLLKFEGLDGPDGIKRKTPAQDEPWHYYNPLDPADTQILDIIDAHYQALVTALRASDQSKAAFEAAWLAHALVDGLTPAHHYPYEEELMRLRGGAGIETRTSPKDKLVMPGETLPQRLSNNWQMWGDKGLLATHFAFEWGVAVIILPLQFRGVMPTEAELGSVISDGPVELFKRMAREVYDLDIYRQFYKHGWTPRLAKLTRTELMPRIINTVTLVWSAALVESRSKMKSKRAK